MKYSIYFAFLKPENQNKRSRKKEANHLTVICCARIIILLSKPLMYTHTTPYYYLS